MALTLLQPPRRTAADRPRLSPCAGPDRAVAEIVAAGRIAYVALETGRGPLVTPVLYGVTHGRLWFLTNRHAYKAGALRKRPRTAWLVRSGDRSAVMTGTARLLSPAESRDLLGALPRLWRLPGAAVSWALRNPRQVLGFARDGVKNPSRVLPQDFVLVELVADSATVADSPASVGAEPAGSWGEVRQRAHERLAPELAALLDAPEAVLGLSTPTGPMVLPVGWDGARGVATAAAPLPVHVGPTPRACLTIDEPVHERPTEQRGITLRGGLRVGDDGVLQVDPERVTFWDGFGTGTRSLAAGQ